MADIFRRKQPGEAWETVVVESVEGPPARDVLDLPDDGATWETVPRYAVSDSAAPTAGYVYAGRVYLTGGHPYTSFSMRTQQVGPATAANVFTGIYDYPAAAGRLAVSANLAAGLNAIADFSMWTGTLNYTPPADGWYWFVFLIGSAGTMPTFQMASAVPAYGAPPIMNDSDSTGRTSLPSGALSLSGGGSLAFWIRYG